MARLIQEKIKRPLADELLFGKLANGGSVQVKVKAKELSIQIKSRAVKKDASADEAIES